MLETFTLGIADLSIFGLILTVCALTGVYFSVFGEKQNTTQVYLFAGKDMSILPVSFSLMATFMSATGVVGIPADIYTFGTHIAFLNVGFLLGPIISSYVFLPIYFNNGVSTIYEYLEKRFGKSTRIIISSLFIFQLVLFSGVVLYAPALALSSVTNLSIWTSVISIGIVCTFYSSVGGMKAVLWTDVFQALLMYACLLAVIIKGCIDLGGIGNIFRSAFDGGRLLSPTFEVDFSTRYTMWSVLLQGLILTVQSYGANQAQVQRLLTLRNLTRSKIASIISAPMLVAFHLLCCLNGIIIYAAYKSCDPLTSSSIPIQSADQLLPYYIVSTMGQYPGLSGLCITGIFSASLSTISSAINSMSAVTYEDFICDIWPNFSGSVLIPKVAGIIYGALCILASYIVENMGDITTATVLSVGIASGTTLGLYILAVFTKTANEMGANLGVFAGFLMAGSIAFIPQKRFYPRLPVGKNCTESSVNMLNFTSFMAATDVSINTTDSGATFPTGPTFPADNFPISHMWIAPFSLAVCLVVGYVASWITTRLRGNRETVPPELLSPLFQ